MCYDVQFRELVIPETCVIEVSVYRLNVMKMLRNPEIHPGGIFPLLKFCGSRIDAFFFFNHPQLPFARFKNYFDESNTKSDESTFQDCRNRVQDVGKKFWNWPPYPNCGLPLARLVPQLTKSVKPSLGRYDEDVTRSAKKKWMDGIRREDFPCSFGKAVALSVGRSNFGFGVYKNDIHGIVAFLQDIYTYIGNLGSIYQTNGYPTAFSMQCPDALRGAKPGDRDDMDDKFAQYVREFFETAKKLDARLAGPAYVMPKGLNFDFGGTAFAIQGGHPESVRVTRRQHPYPTITFVPVMTLLVRNNLATSPPISPPDSGFRDRDLITEAIHDVERHYTGTTNPITSSERIPASCGFSGRQKKDRKYCPIRHHSGRLPVQTCVANLNKRTNSWLQINS
jgi:hypothetical protein